MRRPSRETARAYALFIGGMLGIAWVTVVDSTDRPTLLVLFGGMIGLPLFMGADEKRKRGKRDDGSEDP